MANIENIPKPPKGQRNIQPWNGVERRKNHKILWQLSGKVYWAKSQSMQGNSIVCEERKRSFRACDYD